jgi:hypothetical protein
VEEMTKIFDLMPPVAVNLIRELPANFYGRVVFIFESGKLQRIEKQESFHVKQSVRAE